MDILGFCGVITAVAAAAVIIYKVIHWWSKVVEGMRCQLRTAIVATYYRYQNVEELPQYEAENLHKCFDSYKALGGNSFIDDIMNEMSSWTILKGKVSSR